MHAAIMAGYTQTQSSLKESRLYQVQPTQLGYVEVFLHEFDAIGGSSLTLKKPMAVFRTSSDDLATAALTTNISLTVSVTCVV